MRIDKRVQLTKLWLLFLIFSVVVTATGSPLDTSFVGKQRHSLIGTVLIFGASFLSMLPLRRNRGVDIALLGAAEVVWLFGALAASNRVATILLVIADIAIVLSGYRLALHVVATSSDEIIRQAYGKGVPFDEPRD